MQKITNITDAVNETEETMEEELLEVQPKPTGYKDLDRVHDVKINTNRLVRLAEACQIPMFVAYYDPQKGYEFEGVLPEEVSLEDVQGQYGRFIEFMKICVGFNKEDHMVKVCKRTPNKNSNTSAIEDDIDIEETDADEE